MKDITLSRSIIEQSKQRYSYATRMRYALHNAPNDVTRCPSVSCSELISFYTHCVAEHEAQI